MLNFESATSRHSTQKPTAANQRYNCEDLTQLAVLIVVTITASITYAVRHMPIGQTRHVCLSRCCRRTTGLFYAEKGLKSPPNVTRRGYRMAQGKARRLPNLGATANTTQVAQAACGKDSLTDRSVQMCCCWR
jgi:hypothetical protein